MTTDTYSPDDRVTARLRDFTGYVGVVTRVHHALTRAYIWVRFDGHPWQRDGMPFAFDRWELEKEEPPE